MTHVFLEEHEGSTWLEECDGILNKAWLALGIAIFELALGGGASTPSACMSTNVASFGAEQIVEKQVFQLRISGAAWAESGGSSEVGSSHNVEAF